MSEQWRFVANMIRKQIEKLQAIEEIGGRDRYTRGGKDAMIELMKDLAEQFDHERVVNIETFLRASMGIEKEPVHA